MSKKIKLIKKKQLSVRNLNFGLKNLSIYILINLKGPLIYIILFTLFYSPMLLSLKND